MNSVSQVDGVFQNLCCVRVNFKDLRSFPVVYLSSWPEFVIVLESIRKNRYVMMYNSIFLNNVYNLYSINVCVRCIKLCE